MLSPGGPDAHLEDEDCALHYASTIYRSRENTKLKVRKKITANFSANMKFGSGTSLLTVENRRPTGLASCIVAGRRVCG